MKSLRYALYCGLGLMVAACTITTGPSDERDEKRPWGSDGSGGAGGSDAGAGGDGGEGEGDAGGGSGGSGGQDPGDGDQCIESPSAGECEACAFTQCEIQVCDCKANPACAAALAATDYFNCLEEANGDSDATTTCDIEFLMEANAGDDEAGDLANALGECLHYPDPDDEDAVGCPLECGT